MMKLVFKSMQAMKRLLGLPTGQSLDMFSNISWNTGALIQMSSKGRISAEQRRQSVPASLLLDQISPNGDFRLQRLMGQFESKIAVHLKSSMPLESVVENLEFNRCEPGNEHEHGVWFRSGSPTGVCFQSDADSHDFVEGNAQGSPAEG